MIKNKFAIFSIILLSLLYYVGFRAIDKYGQKNPNFKMYSCPSQIILTIFFVTFLNTIIWFNIYA